MTQNATAQQTEMDRTPEVLKYTKRPEQRERTGANHTPMKKRMRKERVRDRTEQGGQRDINDVGERKERKTTCDSQHNRSHSVCRPHNYQRKAANEIQRSSRTLYQEQPVRQSQANTARVSFHLAGLRACRLSL